MTVRLVSKPCIQIRTILNAKQLDRGLEPNYFSGVDRGNLPLLADRIHTIMILPDDTWEKREIRRIIGKAPSCFIQLFPTSAVMRVLYHFCLN
jgi:hypothetical protein